MWRGVLLVASLAAFAARAEGGFSPVVAELCVNKVICVSPILWQAADQTFFAEEETLKELRIQFPKTGVVAEGRTLYPLSALPGAALHFNEDRQRLELTVEPTAFETFQASMDQRTMPPVSSGRGAFLNYDLSMGRTVAWYSAGLFDLGVHGGTSSFRSSVVLEATDELVKGTRLETCFVHDDPEAMRRVRIGDSISDAATWGGALRFAGLQVSRNFTMQPWLVTAPLLTARGSAVVPTTVDVLLQGQTVARVEVPPGPFEISRLPVVTGAGELTIVTRDALGREQLISQPFYASSSLLAKGLTDYSFSIGTVREGFSLRQARYAGALATGSLRFGVTDTFTLEGHGEYLADFASAAGLNATTRVGTLGVLTLSGVVSASDFGTGALFGLGFERTTRRMSFGAQYLERSDAFRTIVDRENTDPLRRRFVANIGTRITDRFSISLAGVQDETQNARLRGLTANLSFSSRLGQFSVLATDVATTEHDRGLYFSFTRPFGKRSSFNLTANAEGPDFKDNHRVVASMQKSPPLEDGIGYAMRAASDGDYDARLTVRHPHGSLAVDTWRAHGRTSHRVTANGSLIAFAGDVRATRSVSQSYAVVDAKGLAGVAVYLENQPVGRTDENGRLFVGNLRPFELNRISFDANSLPLNVQVQTTRIHVRPADQAGVLVELPLSVVQPTTFRLRYAKSWVPAGAAVTLGKIQTAVGYEGLVFVQDERPDGLWQGEARWPEGSCRFTIETTSLQESGNAGEVNCD
jgi:P pilus assembly protein, porin PapC